MDRLIVIFFIARIWSPIHSTDQRLLNGDAFIIHQQRWSDGTKRKVEQQTGAQFSGEKMGP
jgi:hypothetical protein